MADRRVTHTRKDSMGDITALCNSASSWPRVSKDEAIRHIESRLHSYYVQQPGGMRVDVHVVRKGGVLGGKFLRTDPDGTRHNNLDDLPDC